MTNERTSTDVQAGRPMDGTTEETYNDNEKSNDHQVEEKTEVLDTNHQEMSTNHMHNMDEKELSRNVIRKYLTGKQTKLHADENNGRGRG